MGRRRGTRPPPWSLSIDDDTPDVLQAWKVLGLVDDAAKHADAKASVSLAATGLVGGALSHSAQSWSSPSLLTKAFITVSAVALLYAGVCAGLALLPRTGSDDDSGSMIHFGRIGFAYPDPGLYVADFAALSADRGGLFEDIVTQVWAMARVIRCTFQWCGRAVRAQPLAILTSAASIVTHAVWPH